MEVLNPHRNQDKYLDDLLAPWKYDISYLAAITGFSLPLIWMEVQNLNEGDRKKMGECFAVFKSIRKNLINADIVPIGEIPDGTSWTGFWAKSPDVDYLLIFREWNGKSENDFVLKSAPYGRYQLLLSNRNEKDCRLSLGIDGFSAMLTESASFALWEIRH
jgi:hypothetical protein